MISVRRVAHVDEGGHVIFDDPEVALLFILVAYKQGVSWMIYCPSYWDELDKLLTGESQ